MSVYLFVLASVMYDPSAVSWYTNEGMMMPVPVWVSPFTALTCHCNCACVRLCLTESARLSLRPGRRIQADMIGRPENDLRHIGHVGYDGVTFGDVSFIGDDYSKLQPVNTRSTNTNSSSSRRESGIAKHTRTHVKSTVLDQWRVSERR